MISKMHKVIVFLFVVVGFFAGLASGCLLYVAWIIAPFIGTMVWRAGWGWAPTFWTTLGILFGNMIPWGFFMKDLGGLFGLSGWSGWLGLSVMTPILFLVGFAGSHFITWIGKTCFHVEEVKS